MAEGAPAPFEGLLLTRQLAASTTATLDAQRQMCEVRVRALTDKGDIARLRYEAEAGAKTLACETQQKIYLAEIDGQREKANGDRWTWLAAGMGVGAAVGILTVGVIAWTTLVVVGRS